MKKKLTKITDGASVIHLDEHKSIRAQFIALYMNGNNVTHFDSFVVEHTLKEILKTIGNENITTWIKMVKPPDNGKINMYPQLDNAMSFRLDEINKLKD